ncbi:hypothetical protein HYV43_03690 [Candidatus Micrarchaeota archaeon]|nr:hypothetical protein [Candidatus Micrarchaeota archaeon]
MRSRILQAAVIAALALALGTAAAQDGRDLSRKLLSRIDPADERLDDKVSEDTDKRRARKEDVIQLFARAFEYYKQGDFFTAYRLFNSGTVAYHKMDWPEDETYGRGSYYSAVSGKNFCEKEPANCRAFSSHMLGALRYPELRAAESILISFSALAVSESTPADLRAEAKRECLAAFERYRRLYEANPGAQESGGRTYPKPTFRNCG